MDITETTETELKALGYDELKKVNQKIINLQIFGEAEVIDAAMDAFVKQNGWTEESDETKEDKARLVLRAFIMETVKAYNINQTQIQAREVAEAQTASALDLTTMILTIE
jgi:hypothetical protein